ncbi:hypothetical protein ACFC1B_11420 [Streptomyces xiamenensis]|uniref:mycothiol-dependent nitroreductase Rv2466c family protein n=1 Tax=Streptomyces xiamenensis TaxID=408015 RepID=UPI0035D9936D
MPTRKSWEGGGPAVADGAAGGGGRESLEEWYSHWLADTPGPVRVLVAAERKYGPPMLRDLYTALGERIHHERAPIGPELYAAAHPGFFEFKRARSESPRAS